MRAIVHIPGYLQTFSGGVTRQEIACGASVRDALEALRVRYPGVVARVLDEAGGIRQHVNIFVNNEHVRDLGGLDAALSDGAEIFLLPAVSGGLARVLG